MNRKPAFAFTLLASLPGVAFAGTAVSQIEGTALVSQAATDASDLNTAHTLAGQAIDGLSPAPVAPASAAGRPAAASLKLAKAASKRSAGDSSDPEKLPRLWEDNKDAVKFGGIWAALSAIGLFVPVLGQVVGGIVAGFGLLVMAGASEGDFFTRGVNKRDMAAGAGLAAVGIAAVVAPPIGIPAMLAAGAAVALYGLAKIGAGLLKKDG